MELLFSPSRPVDDAEFSLVQKAQARPEAELYTRITVAQVDGVNKEPKPRIESKPAAPKAKVEVSEEPDEEVEEEPKKRSKTASKPEVKPAASSESLASILQQWPN